jgi:hypothetical protein
MIFASDEDSLRVEDLDTIISQKLWESMIEMNRGRRIFAEMSYRSGWIRRLDHNGNPIEEEI